MRPLIKDMRNRRGVGYPGYPDGKGGAEKPFIKRNGDASSFILEDHKEDFPPSVQKLINTTPFK